MPPDPSALTPGDTWRCLSAIRILPASSALVDCGAISVARAPLDSQTRVQRSKLATRRCDWKDFKPPEASQSISRLSSCFTFSINAAACCQFEKNQSKLAQLGGGAGRMLHTAFSSAICIAFSFILPLVWLLISWEMDSDFNWESRAKHLEMWQ